MQCSIKLKRELRIRCEAQRSRNSKAAGTSTAFDRTCLRFCMFDAEKVDRVELQTRSKLIDGFPNAIGGCQCEGVRIACTFSEQAGRSEV